MRITHIFAKITILAKRMKKDLWRNIETAEVVENNGIKPADLKKAVDAFKQYKADMIKARNGDSSSTRQKVRERATSPWH